MVSCTAYPGKLGVIEEGALADLLLVAVMYKNTLTEWAAPTLPSRSALRGGEGRTNGPVFISNEVAILNQNISFAGSFFKSVACPGKAVVAAVAVQAGAQRFTVFGAVGPRPIVEEKVGGMTQTPDRTGMPRADQTHDNWPSKPNVVHA
jgi:hypothetical protein